MSKYAEVRTQVSQIIPGMRPLFQQKLRAEIIKEKGRKSNYHQYNLISRQWEKQERLLNTEEINSFLEISIRAAACPMPFNMDIWDGLVCPFNCIYCFANYFRASLYTSFFDNAKSVGIRHCNPNYYKRELDKMLKLRGKDPHSLTGIRKAWAMEIPVRFGIRFEDFLPVEKKRGISLEMIRYLKEISYPLMINTKSPLVGEDDYVQALSENEAKTAVHITMLSSDETFNKAIEPGAPSFARRIEAAKNLTSAGVRVVARIEPYLFLMNDEPDQIHRYIEALKDAGVKNITFDTYSYSALNPGIRQNFLNAGLDFDRMFIAESDSQLLGSLLLGKYMEIFKEKGFSCSTFDLGNIPYNDQGVCCEVEDWFETGGWNYGSIVLAAKFIKERERKPVRWSDYAEWVNENGGFLSPALETEVHQLWNMEGNTAYSLQWVQGMVPIGWDKDGVVWAYFPHIDERERLLSIIKA